MLGLHCEHGRKPESKKSEGVVPEAQRNCVSKRQECMCRVNMNWPNDRATPYISKISLKHNHPTYTNFDVRYLETLTPDDIAHIERLSTIANINRRQILQVYHKHEDDSNLL